MQILAKETYLTMIKNSQGSKITANLWGRQNRRKIDITKNGKLSCAFFVSLILKFFDLIREPHATVSGLENDLVASGWTKIKRPKLGSVIVWEKKNGHRHIGFYVGRSQAISNCSKRGYPCKHHFTFGRTKGRAKRKIKAIYWHNFLV